MVSEQRGRTCTQKCGIRTRRKAVHQFSADLSCSRRHDHGRPCRLRSRRVRRVFRLPLLHREETHRARNPARLRHLRHEQRGQPEEVPGLHPGAQAGRPVPGRRQGGKGHLRGYHQGRAGHRRHGPQRRVCRLRRSQRVPHEGTHGMNFIFNFYRYGTDTREQDSGKERDFLPEVHSGEARPHSVGRA